MVIDAQSENANVIISRLRAEARRTREPRLVTVLSRSMRIAACAIAWAHVMGYATDLVDGDASSFRVLLTPVIGS